MFEKIKQLNNNICEKRRFNNTIKFLKKTLPSNSKILDLGVTNKLSKRMRIEGYNVSSTDGQDLDLSPINQNTKNFDAITAFEILEHLVCPFNVLKNIDSQRLFATVPLSLWFSNSFRNIRDERAQHFHEFEDWQFDWLLKKSGWKIIRKEKWKNPSIVPGFRPILRNFYKRYYAIEAEKIN